MEGHGALVSRLIIRIFGVATWAYLLSPSTLQVDFANYCHITNRRIRKEAKTTTMANLPTDYPAVMSLDALRYSACRFQVGEECGCFCDTYLAKCTATAVDCKNQSLHVTTRAHFKESI